MNFPIHSPVQKVENNLFDEKKLSLWVKRDDLIHEKISGNKFRKLKYNLLQAEKENIKCILTFGGAFSNHIAATAYAGKLFGFKTIGIVRGEEPKIWSQTLKQAQADGMKLKFISRESYNKKNEKVFLKELYEEFGDFYYLPEGGENLLAVKGCSEIMEEVDQFFDYVCVACGTGTTLAGIVTSLFPNQKALGFPALKGGDFLKKEIESLLAKSIPREKMQLITDYHFGGYAKIEQELVDFVNSFYKDSAIALDLVYTAKMFFGIFDLANKGFFPEGAKILAVHTGGLQGNVGMASRYGLQLDFC